MSCPHLYTSKLYPFFSRSTFITSIKFWGAQSWGISNSSMRLEWDGDQEKEINIHEQLLQVSQTFISDVSFSSHRERGHWGSESLTICSKSYRWRANRQDLNSGLPGFEACAVDSPPWPNPYSPLGLPGLSDPSTTSATQGEFQLLPLNSEPWRIW